MTETQPDLIQLDFARFSHPAGDCVSRTKSWLPVARRRHTSGSRFTSLELLCRAFQTLCLTSPSHPQASVSVTPFAEYNASLRRRSSLTAWFTVKAIAAWHPDREPRPAALLKVMRDLGLKVSAIAAALTAGGIALPQWDEMDRNGGGESAKAA